MKKQVLIIGFLLLGIISLHSQNNSGVMELSLQKCIQMAIDNNINVQTVRLDQEKSGHKVNEVRAMLLPKINITGSFQDYFEQPITLLPGEIVGRPGTNIAASIGTPYTTGAAIGLSQVLYNQTALTMLKLTKNMEALNALGVEKACEKLTYEMSKLYFLTLTTSEQKILVEDNIARIKRLSDIIGVLVANGMGKQIDYDRINVTLENLYTQLSNVDAALEQQTNLIKYMVVIPIEQNIVLTDTVEIPLLQQSPNIQVNFSNHIDIQLLESQKKLNLLNKKMINHGYIPSLSFSAQFGYQGYRDEFKNYFRSSPENEWYSSSYIAVSLSIPVFDGLEKRAKSQQAMVDYRKTVMQLDDTKERINIDYQNAVNNYNNHKNNVERQKKNIALAEKVYLETALKYGEGLASMSDVLQDEMGLNNAQNTYITALYNFKEAELRIMSLNGEIKRMFNN